MSDNITIEQLCKPLSARVMPKSKLYGTDHTKVSQERALGEQRRAVAENYRKRLSKKISAEKAQ